MAEYIDRAALEKALTMAAVNGKDKDRRTWVKAICVLHDMLTADVAPVVRCKECTYSYDDLNGLYCSYGPCEGYNVPDDFFCKCGERRGTHD